MTQAVVDQLVTAVDNARQSANFCTSGDVDLSPEAARGLSVEGLGEIRLPLRPKTVGEIIAFADTAPYGKGTKTIINQSVRNSLEIKASKLNISDELDQAVSTAARQAARALGLPEDRVQAKPYKLLIYQKGGFFLPHRDSEKRKNMVASMVVMLPSKFGGGELTVQHEGAVERFAFEVAAAAERCEFAAFYADCLHEVRRVTRGVRVCLSYNLCLKPYPKQRPSEREPNAALVSAITEWTKSRPADPMVFALEHQYTASGLMSELLKGNDRSAAEKLIASADQADCHVRFGQVSRHLLQHADDGCHRPFGWSQNVRLEDLELGESYEDEVLIDGWKTVAGKRVKLGTMKLDSSMLISTTPLDEWKPTSFDYEGYTGNAGQTLDRWFHKSAIVIWAKADHFDVLVKMGHRESIEAYLKQQEKGSKLKSKAGRQRAREDDLAFATAIIRDWPSRFPRWHDSPQGRDESAWFKDFAESLPACDNAKLIDDFLQTLAKRDCVTGLDRFLGESLKRFGAETVFPMLKRFLQTTPPPDQYGGRPASGLPVRDPQWLLKIAGSRNHSGLQADQLSELFDLMLRRLDESVVEEQTQRHHRNKKTLESNLILLMKSAVTIGSDAMLNGCLQLRRNADKFFDKRQFDVKVCTELVKWSDKRFDSRLSSLSDWLKEIRDFLEPETAFEPEPPSDFARPDAVD